MAEGVSLTVEVPKPAMVDVVADGMPEDLEAALGIVIRKAREANGLICGLTEVTQALNRRVVHLCVLAEDCDDEDYKKLVKALSSQSQVDLISVKEREKLAQWAGLTKVAADGTVRKAMKCSCLAVRDFGERSEALGFLLSRLH
uniref:40S ribosomal protein S12 n=1 Tax=Trypanosoma congolense (strain IL3000) TaxID=1068625 RepID=G0V059_TRYCI|nr:putative 40S ribosomal protein S12 [Trypanosoma congolense IL3000]